ncbi:hypothetical protein [Actinomadura sp. K4S16]|uniref:hypothetical protein n=1 Tax=Actinomadura sp. K4S16 TaxID=1316147 RepID=UPI0011EF7BB6|nr:hypothetical protein [Actinomadura sp. K4S16]
MNGLRVIVQPFINRALHIGRTTNAARSLGAARHRLGRRILCAAGETVTARRLGIGRTLTGEFGVSRISASHAHGLVAAGHLRFGRVTGGLAVRDRPRNGPPTRRGHVLWKDVLRRLRTRDAFGDRRSKYRRLDASAWFTGRRRSLVRAIGGLAVWWRRFGCRAGGLVGVRCLWGGRVADEMAADLRLRIGRRQGGVGWTADWHRRVRRGAGGLVAE